MRYVARESGLVVAEREGPGVVRPELWLPKKRPGRRGFNLPPIREPYKDLPPLEAFGVAGAFATTMLGSGSGVTPMGLFGGNCKQWVRSDLGITIGTDPYGTGATLQAVTLTGSIAAPADFYLEITFTGSRGVATYKYGANGSAGAMIETGVLTSASHACIGALAGLTINFPVGTYTNGDNYKGVISQWSDQSGNGNHYVQSSSTAAPFYELTAYNGKPDLHFASGATWMTCTSLILGTGNDTPFSVFIAASVDAVTGNRVLFGMGNTGLANPLYDLQVDSSGPTWGFSKRDDSGTVKTCQGGVANTLRHYFSLINDGQTQSFYIDGTLIALTNSGDLNVGATTLNRMSLGARVQAAISLVLACRIAEVWGIDRAATAVELNAAHSYFASRYP